MIPVDEDTSPAAHAVRTALLRAKTPAERLQMTQRLRRGVDRVIEARLRAQYPHDDERTRRMRLGALRLGDDLMKRAFHFDPEVEGR